MILNLKVPLDGIRRDVMVDYTPPQRGNFTNPAWPYETEVMAIEPDIELTVEVKRAIDEAVLDRVLGLMNERHCFAEVEA